MIKVAHLLRLDHVLVFQLSHGPSTTSSMVTMGSPVMAKVVQPAAEGLGVGVVTVGEGNQW